jgi:hypothetical protein
VARERFCVETGNQLVPVGNDAVLSCNVIGSRLGTLSRRFLVPVIGITVPDMSLASINGRADQLHAKDRVFACCGLQFCN